MTDKEITSLDEAEAMVLVRKLLLHNIDWSGKDFDYTQIKLKDFDLTTEQQKYFFMGAMALAMDLEYIAANHFHGHENIDKQCQIENDYMLESVDSALSYIDTHNAERFEAWKETFRKED